MTQHIFSVISVYVVIGELSTGVTFYLDFNIIDYVVVWLSYTESCGCYGFLEGSSYLLIPRHGDVLIAVTMRQHSTSRSLT